MTAEQQHRSGFINIIGKPNVGKSTLMNALVGERMSIITSKPQTTRHRIIGIVSDTNYQAVFSDTPGIIDDPAYKMQNKMNAFVRGSFEDADVVLFMTDPYERYPDAHPLVSQLQKVQCPKFLLVNKIDIAEAQLVKQTRQSWTKQIDFDGVFEISALQKAGVEELFEKIISVLPPGPVYYPKDQFTDRPERFFVSEIIREKILMNYYQEIPYSTEVVVDGFQDDEEENIVRIHATIYVERKSQKYIIIGKKGSAIKQVGIEARADIQKFLEKKVYLELYVKVKDNWRNTDQLLRNFGYDG